MGATRYKTTNRLNDQYNHKIPITNIYINVYLTVGKKLDKLLIFKNGEKLHNILIFKNIDKYT